MSTQHSASFYRLPPIISTQFQILGIQQGTKPLFLQNLHSVEVGRRQLDNYNKYPYKTHLMVDTTIEKGSSNFGHLKRIKVFHITWMAYVTVYEYIKQNNQVKENTHLRLLIHITELLLKKDYTTLCSHYRTNSFPHALLKNSF